MTHTGPADRDRYDLLEQLHRAINEASSEVMNRLAPDCPPLYWEPQSGEPCHGMDRLAGSVYDAAEAAATVRSWADRFDLRRHLDTQPGITRYRGEINGLVAEVWAITDRDAFEAWARYRTS